MGINALEDTGVSIGMENAIALEISWRGKESLKGGSAKGVAPMLSRI